MSYIYFCFWAQNDYKDTDPETGCVVIRFHNVKDYSGITGESKWWGILDARLNDGIFTVIIEDDYHSECYTVEIIASDADFIVL